MLHSDDLAMTAKILTYCPFAARDNSHFVGDMYRPMYCPSDVIGFMADDLINAGELRGGAVFEAWTREASIELAIAILTVATCDCVGGL